MSKIATGCLIIIGNEILSGRTQDTNLQHLATALNDVGVRLVHARVIPDVEETIVTTVNECRQTYDHVFTTGGIGPTHDDITPTVLLWHSVLNSTCTLRLSRSLNDGKRLLK